MSEVDDKDFQDLKDGDFIEIFSTKLNMWLIYEVVSDYGIQSWDENVTHYGYELDLVANALEEKILEAHPFLLDGRRLIVTEDMPKKYWRYNKTAKVLYGGRKRSHEEFDDELPF